MAFYKSFSILQLFSALLTRSSAVSGKLLSYSVTVVQHHSAMQQTYMSTRQDVNQGEYKFRSDDICSLLNVHTCSADGSTVLLGSSCNFMKLENIKSRSLRYKKIGLERSSAITHSVIKREEIRFWYNRNSCCLF